MTEPRQRRIDPSRRRARLHQLAWQQLRHGFAPTEPLSADAIEALHRASLTILGEIGIRMLTPEARQAFRRAGAKVDEDSQIVRFDAELVAQALTTVPERIVLHARNPARDVEIGGDKLAFASVLGPPYCTDIERGRRTGNFADYCDLLRLGQFFNIIHLMAGSPVEPQDIEIAVRHLDATRAMLALSDKVPYVFLHSHERIMDVLTMIALSRGLDLDRLRAEPSVYSIVNANSPLQYDKPMLDGIMTMAEFGQPVLLTPFTLAGATAPVFMAGTLAQQNAEILAGVVLGQLVRPGAPVVYGGASKNVDMRTGAPAYGSPDQVRAAQVSGQLARRYRLPFRSSNFCRSNAADAQAAYESQFTTWGAISGGVNLLMHAAGWLEGGLCASFEKFVIDVEILQSMVAAMEPIVVDEEHLAIEEIAAVGHGGHFFGSPKTLANYETAHYQPLLTESRGHDAWREAGGLDATQRAHRIWKQALKDYEAPPTAPDIAGALDEFVARRKGEGGSPL